MHFLVSVIAFLVAIGILVTFHEFGHFWVARRFGVRVLRFSIGFGKPLFSWSDKHNTEYVIAAIPLGGYVKMLDEREGGVAVEDRPYAFNLKSVWVRFAIVFAGPLFNFIFAVAAFWLMFLVGVEGWVPKIGDIRPDSIAMHAGLQVNDEILQVNSVDTPTWRQVNQLLIDQYGNKQLTLTVKQPNGQTHERVLELKKWALEGDRPDFLQALGMTPYRPPMPAKIADIVPGEPADKAGFEAGDMIVSVNGEPVTRWKDFTDVIAKRIDVPVKTVVERDGAEKALVVIPRAKEMPYGQTVGFVGLVVRTTKMPKALTRMERLGPIESFTAASAKTYEYITLTFKLLGKLISGDMSLKVISGPVSIAQGAGATAMVGLAYYAGFLALISISLGVLNLLPIPILDGGHLLYFVIEMLTGKPVSDRVQIIGFKIGLLLLIFLMTIGFYNDFVRLY